MGNNIIISTNRRKTVRVLWRMCFDERFQHYRPGYLIHGVPRKDLEDAMFSYICENNQISRKVDEKLPMIDSLIDWCIEDDYIRKDKKNNLWLKSEGERFLRWWYYPDSSWLFKTIFSIALSFCLGLLSAIFLKK